MDIGGSEGRNHDDKGCPWLIQRDTVAMRFAICADPSGDAAGNRLLNQLNSTFTSCRNVL
jgi:hypothetical protein